MGRRDESQQERRNRTRVRMAGLPASERGWTSEARQPASRDRASVRVYGISRFLAEAVLEGILTRPVPLGDSRSSILGDPRARR